MTIQVSPGQLAKSKATTQREVYLAALLNQRSEFDRQNLSADLGDWLQDLRDRASVRLQDLAIPSPKDEEWRFTDLSSLLQVSFQAATAALSAEALAGFNAVLPETAESCLVFVNGRYMPSLSSTAGLPQSVTVGNVGQLEEPYAARLRHYLAQQPGSEEVFTTLNTASMTDAAVIWVPKNQVVETPIQLLFISAGETATLSHPRCLVVAEPNSQVTFIEDYVTGDRGYFTNAVTEIWIEENAQVNHTRVQRDRSNAFHIGKTAVSQARHARYIGTTISMGGKVSRHNLEIFQLGEQTETTLNSLTMIAGEQLSDTHSTIAYSSPYGTSRQLHKCIVDDQAHAVFNGKVVVPQAAQLTDAGQLNRNLLISPKARVDAKPQLEIVADNVKCTHGATVGQLDADEVFYLQSRGIDADSARKLLIYAFAFEIIEQVPIASLQQALSQSISPPTS
ncbi:Fe-S cluster assembly protein SufD [Oculatella sp. LEGE 06141]|uniref:Fe-S cluster assembly protein SufD n=1 Tax=Oculatella sp. LEGE 06141 TaxID=1828648 RepID=UPI00187E988C|nr:Fe-S cluster assembly protein SufD [Oculatella sp. LEGE 06141]MBE9181027.1 Fe-S cluster assembly protein SufD [Oculatella sp. LEGE 06141]